MVKIGLIGLMAFLVVLPVFAQEGLSEEDLNLAQRIETAAQALNTTSGYEEKVITKQQFEMTMFMMGQAMMFQTNTTKEEQSAVIPGSNPNVHSFFTIHTEEMSPDGVYSYTLAAEVRLVDGLIYVMAERIPDEGSVLPETLAPLPDGWTQIASPADWPALADLDLDSLLTFGEEFALSSDLDTLAQVSPIFTVEPVTWGDGTPAEVITITVPVANIAAGEGQSWLDVSEGMTSSMLSSLDETSLFSMDYTIDNQGNLLRGRMNIVFNAEGIDATLEDSTLPEGTTYDIMMDMSETRKISGINSVLVPIIAP